MIGEYDAAGTLIQELIWLGDIPVALRGKMACLTGGTCTETANAYIWTDHLNTPREITRVNAANAHVTLWKWDSLPFGESTPNINPSNLGPTFFKHRLPGQYRDPETGLYQTWNRDYSAVLGQYVQPDPLGLAADLNIYRYAKANPISIVDPEGLCGCGQAIANQATNEALNENLRGRYAEMRNTCNYAVAGILVNATGTSPSRQGTFFTGPIPASTWGNANSNIAGFTRATGGQQAGDIVSDGVHVGILVSHPGTSEWAVVSQSSITNQLEINSAGFLNRDGSIRSSATSWRCGC